VIKRCLASSVSWISVVQTRDVERAAIELGLTHTRIMENAGANLAWLASTMLGGEVVGRRITVLAGPGGNGGGGLVAARRLIGWGADVAARLATDPADLAGVPLEQLCLLDQMGASIGVGASGLGVAELFIDAILGYGQRGNPQGDAAALVAATAGSTVLSLDVPTGLELERAIVGEPAVRAAATLTEALPKEALRAEAARPLVGDLYLADISVPPTVYDSVGITYQSPFSGSPIVRLV
jgi:NAD(P)H-hydrate epimerase